MHHVKRQQKGAAQGAAEQVDAGTKQGSDNKTVNCGARKTNGGVAHCNGSGYRRKKQDHGVLIGKADAEGVAAK